MTVLVTGAAGGIGGAGMRALVEAGHDAIGQDKDPFEGASVRIPGDIRDVAVLDAIEEAVANAGELTSVVAAHGVEGAGTIHEISDAEIREVMEVDFETVAHLWDRVRPALEESRGTFIVIASQAGLISERGNAVYCASKSALRGWMRGLERESSAKLRLLHPGGIQTDLLKRALGGMALARGTTYERFVVDRYADTPAGRIAEPAEAGAAIAWAAALQTDQLVELAITGGEVLW